MLWPTIISGFQTSPTFSSTTHTTSGFEIHYHTIYELYYFLEGDVDYLVEGNVYHPTPESLIILSPNVFHGVRINSSKPYNRCTLHFDPNWLSLEHRQLLLSAFPNNERTSHKEVYYENITSFHLSCFFQSLIESQKQSSPQKEQFYQIYLEALLAQLTIMCNTMRPTQVENNVSKTITDIIAYLNQNFTEDISLDHLSEQFFISKNYLNRVFRKAIGTTVFDYLIYKRVLYAKQLLLNGISATEAASQAGFGDYSSFFKSYKKIIGHAPSKEKHNLTIT